MHIYMPFLIAVVILIVVRKQYTKASYVLWIAFFIVTIWVFKSHLDTSLNVSF